MLVHLINKVQKDSYSSQHLNVIIVSFTTLKGVSLKFTGEA